MIVNSKKKILFFLFVLFITNNLVSTILFKISGKAVYDGIGLKNIFIECYSVDYKSYKKISTDKNGNFFTYVENGIYILELGEKNRGYVNSGSKKCITVGGKNVKNIIFILEKECKISGIVKFDDNTPIEGTTIYAANKRGFSRTKSDSNGRYIIAGIKASNNTEVHAIIPGANVKVTKNLVLNEDSLLENIDFIVPKNLSLKISIIDEETNIKLIDPLVMLHDGTSNIKALENQNGEFRFYNLKEKEEYVIIIDHPDYGINTKNISYLGDTLDITIKIKKISNSE